MHYHWIIPEENKSNRKPIALHLTYECLWNSLGLSLSTIYVVVLEYPNVRAIMNVGCMRVRVYSLLRHQLLSLFNNQILRVKSDKLNIMICFFFVLFLKTHTVRLIHATSSHSIFDDRINTIFVMHTQDLHIVQWFEHKHYNVLLNARVKNLQRIQKKNKKNIETIIIKNKRKPQDFFISKNCFHFIKVFRTRKKKFRVNVK